MPPESNGGFVSYCVAFGERVETFDMPVVGPTEGRLASLRALAPILGLAADVIDERWAAQCGDEIQRCIDLASAIQEGMENELRVTDPQECTPPVTPQLVVSAAERRGTTCKCRRGVGGGDFSVNLAMTKVDGASLALQEVVHG